MYSSLAGTGCIGGLFWEIWFNSLKPGCSRISWGRVAGGRRPRVYISIHLYLCIYIHICISIYLSICVYIYILFIY